MHVAIAAVETGSIAQGTLAADAMVKTAEVEILEMGPLSPGKFWVLIGGEVAPVLAAWQRGREVAAESLLDELFIPQLHEFVLPALRGTCAPREDDALGIIETLTAASAIVAADRAAKTTDVALRDLRLADGLGGKGVLWLSGSVSAVQAAVEAGRAEAQRQGLLSRAIVIPRLHPQMKARLF